jgi:hypothetical protein
MVRDGNCDTSSLQLAPHYYVAPALSHSDEFVKSFAAISTSLKQLDEAFLDKVFVSGQSFADVAVVHNKKAHSIAE